ncbi:methyl-CpG-binding domain-containing protein [Ancistrocladus abbreviatus]
MQSGAVEDSFRIRKEASNSAGASGLCALNVSVDTHIVLSPDEGDAAHGTKAVDSQSHDDASKQLVLYDPKANGSHEIEAVPDSSLSQTPPSTGYSTREWRPEISCDDPADIQQDGSRLWAIDKPNIAQPPPGWERELRIRGETRDMLESMSCLVLLQNLKLEDDCGSGFVGGNELGLIENVNGIEVWIHMINWKLVWMGLRYYIAPSGKRLRSTVEVQKYLLEHPEYIREGVTMSQFSFQIPKPLQENYVRKRPTRLTPSCDDSSSVMSRPFELAEVNPLSWASPDDSTVLRLGRSGLSACNSNEPSFDSNVRPVKKPRTASSSLKRMHNGDNLKYHSKTAFGDPHASMKSAL